MSHRFAPPRGALLFAGFLLFALPSHAQQGAIEADPGDAPAAPPLPAATGAARQVEIDVIPGDDANTVIAGSEEGIPVAVFSSPDFDAALIDAASLTLGGAPAERGASGRPMGQLFDLDGDGRSDLIAHFAVRGVQGEDDGTVRLHGRLVTGVEIAASAPLNIAQPGDMEPVGLGRSWRGPEAPRLPLVVFPNPTRGPFQLALALPGGGSASVELLDIAGRRIECRSVAARAGSARASFAWTRRIEPGRYLLRVTQGARVTATTVTVLR